MAILEAERRLEEVQQLRLLARSPGWALCKVRLLAHVKSREVVKAAALRSNQHHEATLNQGWIDGVIFTLAALDKWATSGSLEPEAQTPAY